MPSGHARVLQGSRAHSESEGTTRRGQTHAPAALPGIVAKLRTPSPLGRGAATGAGPRAAAQALRCRESRVPLPGSLQASAVAPGDVTTAGGARRPRDRLRPRSTDGPEQREPRPTDLRRAQLAEAQ